MRLVPIAFLFLSALPAHAAPRAAKPAAAKPVAAAAKPVVAAAQPAATPEALLEQSRDAQNKGEAELALRLAQAAIVADPARPASYVALGELYAAAGQADYARSFYDAALEIDPADSGAQRAVAALGNAKATAANSP